jgi:tyrosinase
MLVQVSLCLVILFIYIEPIQSAIVLDAKDCVLPRIRKRWGDLSGTDKQNYLKSINLLKKAKESPRPGLPEQSIYDTFVWIHAYNQTILGSNTNYAHGFFGFLPWHRYFLWLFENALGEVVTNYNKDLKAKNSAKGYMDACIAVPYWDWENDAKKEGQSSIFGNDTYGQNKTGVVNTGVFANWTTSQGVILQRWVSPKIWGGIQTGPASLLTLITNSAGDYTAFHNSVTGIAHGEPHLYIGGDRGPMGSMFSPDDPIFWMHHSNLDRIFAMWQDCYDYDKSATITDTIFPSSWNVTYKGAGVGYTRDTPMPFSWMTLDTNCTATRFAPAPTPLQMLSMGSASQLGYRGLYYRYASDDLLVETLESSFPGTCNFDTLVNYAPGGVKKRFVPPSAIFNNTKLQEQLNRINKMWARRTPKQKLHYLSLWECAITNRDPSILANLTTPTKWLEMNGQSTNQWKTICQNEGWLYGYDTLAWLEDAQDSVIPMTTSNIIIILCSIFGVLIVIGIIVGVVYFNKASSVTETLNVASALNEPMLDSGTDTY